MFAKKNKNTTNKKNKLFAIILLLLTFSLVIYILYKLVTLILVPTDVVNIENGVISAEESVIGYVIRDEKVAKGNNYENGMYQVKAEGEKVANGDPIFRYYGNNEEDLNYEKIKYRKQCLDKQIYFQEI